MLSEESSPVSDESLVTFAFQFLPSPPSPALPPLRSSLETRYPDLRCVALVLSHDLRASPLPGRSRRIHCHRFRSESVRDEAMVLVPCIRNIGWRESAVNSVWHSIAIWKRAKLMLFPSSQVVPSHRPTNTGRPRTCSECFHETFRPSIWSRTIPIQPTIIVFHDGGRQDQSERNLMR